MTGRQVLARHLASRLALMMSEICTGFAECWDLVAVEVMPPKPPKVKKVYVRRPTPTWYDRVENPPDEVPPDENPTKGVPL